MLICLLRNRKHVVIFGVSNYLSDLCNTMLFDIMYLAVYDFACGDLERFIVSNCCRNQFSYSMNGALP
jgi:hypothetical protein